MSVAVAELERFASVQVHGKVKSSDRTTGNIVAVLFEHETSRALDPHLRTHCIIFNATHDASDRRWKALHNYEMLAAQKFVENVYFHELAVALRTFGYSVVNAARGDFQLAEVPRELCERFSKRHREIDEKTRALLLAQPGMEGRNIHDVREHIAHNERSRKMRALPREELRRLWDEQISAKERGAMAVPADTRNPADEPMDRDAATTVDWAEEHLFDRRSVVREHELWRYALEIARGGWATLADVKGETARRDYIREKSGKLTRRDVLAREWAIVQLAKNRARKHAPLASPRDEFADGLAEDQRRALTHILDSRASEQAERERIAEYRAAVKEAAAGAFTASFDRLDQLGAVSECPPDTSREELAAAHVDLAEKKESAIVVSQTWAEIDELNERIRGDLRGRKLLAEAEQTITSLKPVDLTAAQKRDSRFYPEDHVVVFNRRVARCQRGDVGRLRAITPSGAVIDTGHSLHLLKPAQLDAISVCRPQRLALSHGDRLQLKANAVAANGARIANGELVTVAKIKTSGEIVLEDGRTLPASYRQFLRGYAVTSYGSQGKTVDHVLFADSAIRAATNAQQWYVSISRGRKSVRIFTHDKTQLRTNLARSRDRPLAMDLKPPRNRGEALRHILLHGARRGRAFAGAICMAFTAKRRGAIHTLKPTSTP